MSVGSLSNLFKTTFPLSSFLPQVTVIRTRNSRAAPAEIAIPTQADE